MTGRSLQLLPVCAIPDQKLQEAPPCTPSRTGNLIGQHLIASERTHEDASALSLGCPALPYTSNSLLCTSVIVQAVFRFHPGGVGVTGGHPPPCRQLSAQVLRWCQ